VNQRLIGSLLPLSHVTTIIKLILLP